MNLVIDLDPAGGSGLRLWQGGCRAYCHSHVLAMYAPSFITGHVIARFGVEKVMATGLVILAAAGAVAIAGVDLMNFMQP